MAPHNEEVLRALIDQLKGSDRPVEEVRTCAYLTAVVSRFCGISSTHGGGQCARGRGPVRGVGRLTEMSALQLAEYVHSDHPLEAAIGMAAINSLIEVREKDCVNVNALEILIEKGRDKEVAVIGHFPFVNVLKSRVKALYVIEKRPQEGDLPANKTAEILPRCDIVAITGASFINHSFSELISLCRRGYVIVIGPSSPMHPLLFDYGVDAVAGIRVVDQARVLQTISQGASFRAVQGIRQLVMMKR